MEQDEFKVLLMDHRLVWQTLFIKHCKLSAMRCEMTLSTQTVSYLILIDHYFWLCKYMQDYLEFFTTWSKVTLSSQTAISLIFWWCKYTYIHVHAGFPGIFTTLSKVTLSSQTFSYLIHIDHFVFWLCKYM